MQQQMRLPGNRFTGIVFGIILAATLVQCKSKNMEQYMIVGTYTNTDSKGIYVFRFDSETGKISEVSAHGDIVNPSYLTLSGQYLYAVSETGGDDPGSAAAYRFDAGAGKLTFLNQQPTGGDAPCYIEVDESGSFAAVANYSGGSVTALPLKKDGSLGQEKQVVQHEGGSVNKDRQDGPHVHQSTFTPDQKFLLTPDLGKDRVMIYRFDKHEQQPLSLYKEIVCKPGSGPRHISFHPSKNFAYLIHELIPVVTVYSFDGGNFTEVQELPTWKDDFTGQKDGAEVKVSPDGRFLYISNRGDQNVIGIYEIDQQSGKLTRKGMQPVNGKGPRDFEIDPSGNFLLVANQLTNNIVTFKRDQENGMLSETGNLQVPIPVCIKFTSK